jgi:hypothetical protein
METRLLLQALSGTVSPVAYRIIKVGQSEGEGGESEAATAVLEGRW